RLALQRVVARVEHLLREGHGAIARRLSADPRAAPADALAGEHAGELVLDALVLAEEEPDLAASHADVTGGDVGELADVALQLGHERLAEAHDFAVALAVRIEV